MEVYLLPTSEGNVQFSILGVLTKATWTNKSLFYSIVFLCVCALSRALKSRLLYDFMCIGYVVS